MGRLHLISRTSSPIMKVVLLRKHCVSKQYTRPNSTCSRFTFEYHSPNKQTKRIYKSLDICDETGLTKWGS